MTYSSAFSSGVTAMLGHSLALEAISENIANSTTTGYKTTDILFQEVVWETMVGAPGDYGGIQPVVHRRVMQQAPLLPTGNAFDAAIDGRGFFVTNTSIDASGEYQLSRAGEFKPEVVDEAGTEVSYLTDTGGNYLLGWPSDGSGGFTIGTDGGSLVPIQFDPTSTLQAAIASTQVTVGANLPAETTVGQTQALTGFVYDSNGTVQPVTTTWTRQAAANTWQLDFTASAGAITSGSPVVMTFDAAGVLVGPTTATITATWTDPTAAASTLTYDFTGMTQYAGAMITNTLAADGAPEARLDKIFINDRGEVVGRYTNNLDEPLFKLPLGDVISPNRLSPRSGTHYAVNDYSGDITLYDTDVSTRGDFIGGAIEQSATDLANEFTKLIQTQRAYDLAATDLRTIDEMMQTAIQL